MRRRTSGPDSGERARALAGDVDVLVVGAGITGIYQLYRARNMRLEAKVTAAVYDDASATWTVEVADGRVFRARFLVAATGVLSVPFFPAVPGRDEFRGESYHTGLWPATPVDFTGKRVA